MYASTDRKPRLPTVCRVSVIMSVNEQIPEETPKLFDAFISYSSHDSNVATRLEEELRQEGFVVCWINENCWLATILLKE